MNRLNEFTVLFQENKKMLLYAFLFFVGYTLQIHARATSFGTHNLCLNRAKNKQIYIATILYTPVNTNFTIKKVGCKWVYF